MRAGMRSLCQEERGASVVIGVMLMLLVVAAMWGTIQAYHVPNWNKDVEYEHLNMVHDDMITFKSDVEDVAVSRVPKSSNIHMGVRYPSRIFLANPGTGVAGSLTSDNVSVSILYTIDAPGDPTITQTYNSNRISYEVQGSIDSPKLVYEHGVIIRDYGDESATTDQQPLIVGDEIYIPVLIGDLTSLSSMETESIEIKPLSASFSRTNIKSVEITIDTGYPEVWEQLLAQDSSLEAVETSPGAITDAMIDTLEFDASDCYYPDILHISGDIYAIAYRGSGNDGFLKTVEIAADGAITDAVIDTLEFDASDCYYPDILHISGDIYAIAYQGTGSDGFLKTVEIAADGAITDAVIDTLEFDTANGREPNVIYISGDIYAIAYRGSGSDGFLKTVEIAADGAITDTVIDTLEFDTSDGYYPDILHISGDIYAIAYRGSGSDGFLKTVEIPSVGAIVYVGAEDTTIRVDLEQSEIIIESTSIKQIILSMGDVITDALYAGMVTFSTESEPMEYTSIDTSQDYPSILDITIDEGDDAQTQSTITVTVKNTSAPFDIHADFSGLTNDPDKYDVFPDYTSPDSISATGWDVPNENTVRWTNITHPEYAGGDVVIVSFWVINTENNMHFFISRVFNRRNASSWY